MHNCLITKVLFGLDLFEPQHRRHKIHFKTGSPMTISDVEICFVYIEIFKLLFFKLLLFKSLIKVH